jgi:hypothetical protein
VHMIRSNACVFDFLLPLATGSCTSGGNEKKNQRPIEQWCISEHLRIVEVKCQKVDERVHNVLKC